MKKKTVIKIRFPYLLLCKIGIAVFLLWVLYYYEYLELSLLSNIVSSHWLLIGFIFIAWITYPICALRWHWLLSVQGIKTSIFSVFKIVYASAFIGLYLPGVVGGDIVRIAFGLKLTKEKISEMSISVLMDRLLGVMGILFLGFFASLFYLDKFWIDPQLRNLSLILGSIFLSGLLLVVVIGLYARHLYKTSIFKKWNAGNIIFKLLSKIAKTTALYSKSSGCLIKGWGLSILIHSKNILLLFILAKIMRIGELGVIEFAMSGAVTFLVNFLPLTPSGIGVGEAAFSQLSNSLSYSSLTTSYATIFVAFRVITALSLLPAITLLPHYLKGVRSKQNKMI